MLEIISRGARGTQAEAPVIHENGANGVQQNGQNGTSTHVVETEGQPLLSAEGEMGELSDADKSKEDVTELSEKSGIVSPEAV